MRYAEEHFMKYYFTKWTYRSVENQISLNQEIQSLECESVPVTKGDTINARVSIYFSARSVYGLNRLG